jgi:hypothetical protein
MGQIGFKDAAPQSFRRASNLINGSDDRLHQLVHVERATVGEVAFRQRPHAFVRVEVGGIGGKVLDVQARMSPEELGQRRAVVGGRVVEEDDDRTAEVAEQLAQKATHFFLSDVIEEK